MIQRLFSKYQRMQDEILAAEATPPDFSGRGIVICAGGPRYFTCAWVLVHVLREALGCTLPIQIWYRGPVEMDARMVTLLRGLDRVEPVDATRFPEYQRIAFKHGWELKPFAILNCAFREVILIDADNVPVVDPAFLFDAPQYAATGAIFWPDLAPIGQDSRIWEITRVGYCEEPSFESGQIVVDKLRCWKPLLLTMHMNEQSGFYGRFLWGDKDTFHFAWRMAGCEYAMPSQSPPVKMLGIHSGWRMCNGPVLLQIGFDGELIFQHRNRPKWVLSGYNLHYPGFLYHDECLEFLNQLGGLWNGRVSTGAPRIAEDCKASGIGGRWFRYVLIGQAERLLEFLPNQRIGCGGTQDERLWRQSGVNRDAALEIEGDHGVTCRLRQDSDGVWKGRWLYNERFLVELIPWAGPR